MRDVHDYVTFLEKHPDVQGVLKDMATGYSVEEADKAFADVRARKNIKTLFVTK